MAFNKTEKSDSPMRKKGGMRRRKKVCVFCGKDNVIDYKDTAKLKRYVSERGKILCKTSESSYSSYQTCSPRCTDALHSGIISAYVIRTKRKAAWFSGWKTKWLLLI